MTIGRSNALGLAAVLIIASSVVSVPSNARADDQGAGRIIYRDSGNIHAVNADSTDDRTLTKDGRSRGASWSPDGKQILFLHDYNDLAGLYVMNRDGSNPHLLRHLEGRVDSASWSPDGKTLALMYWPKVVWKDRRTPSQPRATPGFFLLSVDGQDEPRLVRENAWGVKWSPDGKKVVFTENPSPGRWIVHVANADGSNDVPLITSDIFGFTEAAAWSPDGRQIALVASTTSGEHFGIYIVNSDGSGMRPLYADSGEWQCDHPSWSPDGSQVAFFCFAMPACSAGSGGNIHQILGKCVRPLFVMPVNDPHAKPTQITQHDAMFPEFAPR